jgi:transposase
LIDILDEEIMVQERELRRLGSGHHYLPLLTTIPGIAWILGFTFACEIGDIARLPSARKLCGYTGLCPKVDQSGERDRRGPPNKNAAAAACPGR